MPRKTIASLEAEVEHWKSEAEANDRIAQQYAEQCRDLHAAQAERALVPPNTYLSYLATGDAELDALQVVDRTIGALSDPAARQRLLEWVYARYRATQED